jgi:acyl-CoA thioesterase I
MFMLSVIVPAQAETGAASGPNDAAKIIRILPLGDSITQGGRRDREEYTYRYPLYYLLREAGYPVDFIGSQKAGLEADAVWPDRNGIPFDPDHEGHYGWKTAEVRDKLPAWMATYPAPPDVALIHLGSNNYAEINYYASVIRPMQDIIGILRRSNPRVIILIGQLNENGAKSWVIRQLFKGLAYLTSTETSPVVTVDHYKGWREDRDDPLGDTFDGAHPNPRGQAKMAAAWFARLTPYLDQIRKQREQQPR